MLRSEMRLFFLATQGIFVLSEHDSKFIGLSKSALEEEGFCCHQTKFKKTMWGGGGHKTWIGPYCSQGQRDDRRTERKRESCILFTNPVSCFSSEPVIHDFNLIVILAVSHTCNVIS